MTIIPRFFLYLVHFLLRLSMAFLIDYEIPFCVESFWLSGYLFCAVMF